MKPKIATRIKHTTRRTFVGFQGTHPPHTRAENITCKKIGVEALKENSFCSYHPIQSYHGHKLGVS